MFTSLGIKMLEASINLFPFLFFLFISNEITEILKNLCEDGKKMRNFEMASKCTEAI